MVDTGPWIFGRKVVLPAGAIETIDLDNHKVVVRLTKDQIKGSPELDEAGLSVRRVPIEPRQLLRPVRPALTRGRVGPNPEGAASRGPSRC